jgi:hypothetical protein
MIIVFYETPTFGLATKHRFFNPVYSDEIMKNLYARQFLKNRGLLTKHEKITLIDEFNPIKMPVANSSILRFLSNYLDEATNDYCLLRNPDIRSCYQAPFFSISFILMR